MTNQTEAHAEAILRAAGSSLKHYTMPATRTAILDAVREAIGQERAAIVAWLRENPKGMLEYEEFYADAIERGDHITLATGDKQP